MVKRWVALALFVAILVTVFIRLGEWQLHRLDARKQSNARIEAYRNQPVRPYSEVFGATITEEMQWQRVTVSGHYLTGDQFQARYRNQGEGPGSEVITPLRTTSGELVLIDRGFLLRPQGEPDPDVLPAAPSGEVTVVGHVRRNERGKDNAIVPVQNKVRLINAPAIGASLGQPVLDGYISLLSSDPPQGDELVPISPPELSEGPHLSYAFQWFSFTLIAVVGGFVLIRGDLRDRRRARGGAH